MSAARRVVVTGLGVCSPIGLSVERFWKNLLEGVSGISSTPDDFAFLPSRVCGSISEDQLNALMEETKSYLDEHQCSVDWRTLSRGSALAICAAKQALTQAGWKPSFDSHSRYVGNRAGVHFGVGMEGVNEVAQTSGAINARRYKGIGPYALTRSLGNMPAGAISRLWGLRGPCLSVNAACATGLHSIGDAYRMIQHGEAELMLAGACEAVIVPWALAAFSRIRALCTQFNEAPAEASRPFDVRHDGFVMSEGAGAIVLQAWPPTPEVAALCERSSSPIAEIIGFGRAGDAYTLVSPDPTGDGAYRSMRAALLDAKISTIDQVDHINCHATSTPLGDAIELAAVSRLMVDFSEQHRADTRPPIVVNSIKGHLGHLLGGAGAVESVYSVLSVNRGMMAGNLNLHQPIGSTEVEKVLTCNERHAGTPERTNLNKYLDALERQVVLPRHGTLAIPYTDRTVSHECRVVLSNSFGFGGTNGSLVFAEWIE
ncbi:unnamed protein product [Dicrocoelium dendriticum]|nr:unnamed protein product [Dicrocoelium dendriticum]